jgi:hypothetical protein
MVGNDGSEPESASEDSVLRSKWVPLVAVAVVYISVALWVQHDRVAKPNAARWGVVLPVLTPAAFLISAASLWRSVGPIRALAVSFGLVCLAYIVFAFIAGSLWGT